MPYQYLTNQERKLVQLYRKRDKLLVYVSWLSLSLQLLSQKIFEKQSTVKPTLPYRTTFFVQDNRSFIILAKRFLMLQEKKIQGKEGKTSMFFLGLFQDPGENFPVTESERTMTRKNLSNAGLFNIAAFCPKANGVPMAENLSVKVICQNLPCRRFLLKIPFQMNFISILGSAFNSAKNAISSWRGWFSGIVQEINDEMQANSVNLELVNSNDEEIDGSSEELSHGMVIRERTGNSESA